MESWLADEGAGSVFKDERLTKRFKSIVETMSKGTGKTIPEVCEEWAMAKATYRFLSNERVEESEILAGHFNQCSARVDAVDGPVLVLHDTTEFSYKRENHETIGKTRKGVRLDTVASNMRQEYTVCGILMHASLAITPEGLLLGLTSTRFWTRDAFKNTTEMKRHVNPTRIPISKKLSDG